MVHNALGVVQICFQISYVIHTNYINIDNHHNNNNINKP